MLLNALPLQAILDTATLCNLPVYFVLQATVAKIKQVYLLFAQLELLQQLANKRAHLALQKVRNALVWISHQLALLVQLEPLELTSKLVLTEPAVKIILFQFVVLVLQDTNAHLHLYPQRRATLVNIKTLLDKLVALPVQLARHAPTGMRLLIHVQQGMHLIQLKQLAFLKLLHPVLQQRIIMNSHGLIPESV